MGKRKKSVKSTKKAKDKDDEDVIKVNIILDFEPGDDFENVKHHQQSASSAESTFDHGLTLTRWDITH